MKQKKIILTLDLEADHAGLAKEKYQLWQEKYIQDLVRVLKAQQVPLSVFVVAKALNKKRSKTINLLKQAKVDFHLHLHDHVQKKQDDFSEEIAFAANNFQNFFNHRPLAYRAPAYNIRLQDLSVLSSQNIELDSSCLPSIWQKPSHFFQSRSFLNNNYVKELPITVLKPLAIPNALSWMKLLGWNYFIKLFKFNENLHQDDLPLIFVFHLHDLFLNLSSKQLNGFWHFIYSRNADRGLQYFEKYIIYLKKEKFEFEQISNYL